MIEREFELPDGRTLNYHNVGEVRTDFDHKRIIVITKSFVTENMEEEVVELIAIREFTLFDPDLLEIEELEDIIETEDLEVYVEVPKVNTETVVSLKAAKRAQINDRRDYLEKQGFMYAGKLIDSNLMSVVRIINAGFAAISAIIFEIPWTVDWTTADNSIITLDSEQVLEMQMTLTNFAQDLHDRATYLKGMVDAITSTDLETVRAALALIPDE
jgi:hypothetical protein